MSPDTQEYVIRNLRASTDTLLTLFKLVGESTMFASEKEVIQRLLLDEASKLFTLIKQLGDET